MKKISYILPILIFGLLSIIGVLFIIGKQVDVGLSGVTFKIEKPLLSCNALLKGSYQSKYDAWFTANYPLRSIFIKNYNQLLYSLKCTTNGVVVGKSGWLYEIDYIENMLSQRERPSDSDIDEYVKVIKKIQDVTEAKGKMFYYILSPSKAEVYPEYVPDKYFGARELNKSNNHYLMRKALESNNINYVDMYDVMMKIKFKNEYPTFVKTGTHWTMYGAYEGLLALFDKISERYGYGFPKVSAEISSVKAEKSEPVDKDIYWLTNIWGGEVSNDYTSMSLSWDGFSNLNLFYLGTSFGIQLFHLTRNWYAGLTFYEYFVNLWRKTPTGYSFNKLEQFDESKVLSDFDNATLILLENNAQIIPLHSHKKFADLISRNFSNTNATSFKVQRTQLVRFKEKNNVILNGVYGIEDWGCWSAGGEVNLSASLDFEPVSDVSATLDFILFNSNEQKIEVYTGKVKLTEIDASIASPHIIKIPKKYITNGRINLTFRISNPKSPKELNMSDDGRRLGIGFVSIAFNDNNLNLYKNEGVTERYHVVRFNELKNNVLLEGVYGVEDWGRWSYGKEVNLSVSLDFKPVSDVSATLDFTLFNSNEQKIEVYTGRVKLTEIDASITSPYMIKIPKKYIINNQINLTFRISNPKSPKELNMGDDGRKLGIGFVSIMFNGKI